MSKPADGSTANFNEISQFTVELSLLSVSGNGRPPYWNFTSDFDFDQFIVSGMANCIAYQISSKSVTPRRSCYVTSIFQDGGYGGARTQSTTLEFMHRHEKLAPESSIWRQI